MRAAWLVAIGVGMPLAAGCQPEEAVDASTEIEVVELSKQSDPNERSEFLRRACEQWTLTQADIERFFENAEPITPEEHHQDYVVLPCSYSGTLMRGGGERRAFEINGGSFGRLDGSLYGCKSACSELFLPFGAYDDEGDQP